MGRMDSLEKGPDSGKDWRWKEKGMAEDEMVGWHHWLNGHEFEQALGVGETWCAKSMEPQRVGHDWATELVMLRQSLLIAQDWAKVLTQFQCCVSLSVIPDSVTPWTAALQAPPSWDLPGRNTGIGATSLSRGSSWTGDQTCVFGTSRWVLYH